MTMFPCFLKPPGGAHEGSAEVILLCFLSVFELGWPSTSCQIDGHSGSIPSCYLKLNYDLMMWTITKSNLKPSVEFRGPL